MVLTAHLSLHSADPCPSLAWKSQHRKSIQILSTVAALVAAALHLQTPPLMSTRHFKDTEEFPVEGISHLLVPLAAVSCQVVHPAAALQAVFLLVAIPSVLALGVSIVALCAGTIAGEPCSSRKKARETVFLPHEDRQPQVKLTNGSLSCTSKLVSQHVAAQKHAPAIRFRIWTEETVCNSFRGMSQSVISAGQTTHSGSQ